MFDRSDVVLGCEGDELPLLSLLQATHIRSDTMAPACVGVVADDGRTTGTSKEAPSSVHFRTFGSLPPVMATSIGPTSPIYHLNLRADRDGAERSHSSSSRVGGR